MGTSGDKVVPMPSIHSKCAKYCAVHLHILTHSTGYVCFRYGLAGCPPRCLRGGPQVRAGAVSTPPLWPALTGIGSFQCSVL